jgi:KEOPS complex subunit Cgi121
MDSIYQTIELLKSMVFKIIGTRGKIHDLVGTMKTLEKAYGGKDAAVQLMRADRIFGALHLTSAAEHASRAFEQGRNRSDNIGVELILYAAAERQITGAIDKLGVRADTKEIAIAIIGKAEENELLAMLGLERDDAVLEPSRKKDYRIFGITDEELASVGEARLQDLVLERVAMSELDR